MPFISENDLKKFPLRTFTFTSVSVHVSPGIKEQVVRKMILLDSSVD